MKSSMAVLALGLLAIAVQGALARAIAPPWCPDLAWLVVVGLGLRWPGFLSGFVLAAVLGFAMDVVSGSLLGQHALLRMLTYAVAALASRQLDLAGGIPVALTGFALSLGYAFGVVATRGVFGGGGHLASLAPESLGLEVFAVAVAQALVSMLCAGFVVGLVERIVNRWAEEDLARRGALSLGYSGYSRYSGRART